MTECYFVIFHVLTGASNTNVVVRVRGRVVPVRAARTGVRAVVPVAAENHGANTHAALYVCICASMRQAFSQSQQSTLVTFEPDFE